MYNQPEVILEQYDLDINQITKGRGAYICDTDKGMKLLMPFRGSKERAAFLKRVLEELESQGYPVEQILGTREGEPLVEDDTGIRYWLKSQIAGAECSAGREIDMRQAVRQLARFHETVERCHLQIPDFMINSRNDPKILYERHYRELVKLKNYVKNRKTKNEFERKFQEQYPHYIAEAERTLEMLKTQENDVRCQLCHGDCNQHNVVRTGEGFRLIHFENMCYGPEVSDLSNFLRKMLEKNNWSPNLGIALLEEYAQIRNLTKGERRQLYITLLFPEKFWKISNHYANSHKAWVSGRDIEKLERIIEQETFRSIFLEKLFSII